MNTIICNKQAMRNNVKSLIMDICAFFRVMAVTRSVSKDEYGGEGRGSRNQGVVSGL